MLHSIYDLTTYCRKTAGDVPAKLVVCSHSIQLTPSLVTSSPFLTTSSAIGRFNDRCWVEDVPIRELNCMQQTSCADTYQGGRLVTERRMVSDLYIFDLETFQWEMINYSSGDDVPQPRYFHSADACECSPRMSQRLFLISVQQGMTILSFLAG